MKNYDTPGMEFWHDFSIPEDKGIVAKPVSVASYGKLWDATGHILQIPSATQQGLTTPFPAYRAGEFNSAGNEGFELHTENQGLTSWWTPTHDNIIFVRVISGISKTAIQINLATGQTVGAAKTYVILANGQFHYPPETHENEIYQAIPWGDQWGLIITGYEAVAQTKIQLFTFKDIDLRLAFDLDAEGHLIDARLTYAGIWYGVYQLRPIYPAAYHTEYTYWNESWLRCNDHRACFVCYDSEYAQYGGTSIEKRKQGWVLRIFDYDTITWGASIDINTSLNNPSPNLGLYYAVEPYNIDNVTNNVATLTSNNNLYLCYLQVAVWKNLSGFWKTYHKLVFLCQENGVWSGHEILAESAAPAYDNEICGGGIFNNNGFGIAYYLVCVASDPASSNFYVKERVSGTWGTATEITEYANQAAYTYVRCESNYDRAYLIHCSKTSSTIYASVYSGGSWTTDRLDNSVGILPYYYRINLALADDQQKALILWGEQESPGTGIYRAYSKFYSSTGWSLYHKHVTTTTADVSIAWTLGAAYDGTNAYIVVYGSDGTTTGLWVDIATSGTWSGLSCIATYTGTAISGIYESVFLDSDDHFYFIFQEGTNIKAAYYNGISWTTSTLNTVSAEYASVAKSGTRLLVVWNQANYAYAVMGEQGSFTSPQRISYYRPDFFEYLSWLRVIACVSSEYLAFMTMLGNKLSPLTTQTSLIANTGYYPLP